MRRHTLNPPCYFSGILTPCFGTAIPRWYRGVVLALIRHDPFYIGYLVDPEMFSLLLSKLGAPPRLQGSRGLRPSWNCQGSRRKVASTGTQRAPLPMQRGSADWAQTGSRWCWMVQSKKVLSCTTNGRAPFALVPKALQWRGKDPLPIWPSQGAPDTNVHGSTSDMCESSWMSCSDSSCMSWNCRFPYWNIRIYIYIYTRAYIYIYI